MKRITIIITIGIQMKAKSTGSKVLISPSAPRSSNGSNENKNNLILFMVFFLKRIRIFLG